MTMAQPPIAHGSELRIGGHWHPVGHPLTAECADTAARVTAMAERPPGFGWRCVDQSAQPASDEISLCDGDPGAICTLAVWQFAKDPANFILRTVHGAFVKRRVTWFRPQNHRTCVIWPVPAGHVPTFAEGVAQLARLVANGPSAEAHDFALLRQSVAQPAQAART